MYMEPRKMVLMNLLQGRNRDTDIENRLVDSGERRRWDAMREVALKHTHMYMIYIYITYILCNIYITIRKTDS